MVKSSNDGPIEEFRRVTAAAMRAISRNAEISVTFTPDSASLLGDEARLPLPSRDLPYEEVCVVRGESDSLALRQRHHNPVLHSERMPVTSAAQALYDTIEQVRVEAIGAEHMAGVANNLDAAIEDRCRSKGYAGARGHNRTQSAALGPQYGRFMAAVH